MSGARGPWNGWRRARRHGLRTLRNFLAGLLGPPLIRAWVGTLRVRFHGDLSVADRFVLGPTRGIYVFWHQRLLFFAGHYRGSRFRVVISTHGDGEMIARVIARLGMVPVRGSSTRGGSRAVLELVRNGADPVNVAITPDGPRGPRHHVQQGAIYLASRTGLPVYPAVVSFARSASLRTWDRFILPCPFTRALVCLGNPLRLPENASREAIEEARQALEAGLRELTRTADEDFARLYGEAKPRRELPVAP
jgi:hypothetical protein